MAAGRFQEGAGRVSKAAPLREKHGIKIVGSWTLEPEHQTISVVEVPTVDAWVKYGMEPELVKYSSLQTSNYFKVAITWEEYLKLVQIDVAIEVKLWLARVRFQKSIDWDIRKLTEQPNTVQNGYFINFAQLDFKTEYNRKYYQELRQYLTSRKQSGIRILCVPMKRQIQPNPKDDWI
jgi:hypothetical protein